ncbi:MAG: hypothetical protein QM790_20050 [Nibricoccus sp.]
MSEQNRPNRKVLVIVALLLLALIAVLLMRCSCSKKTPVADTPPSPQVPAPEKTAAAVSSPGAERPDEILTPATVQAPAAVMAGAVFRVQWTGPDNPEDYLTIVPRDAAEGTYKNYRQTREGSSLDLTAPMDAGDYEVRYVAARSRKTLGRAPVVVQPVTATLQALGEAVLGTVIQVSWTGPNNAGDYVTIVPKDTPDGQYGNYTETTAGKTLNLTLPPTAGPAELRYMSGQDRRVLARRAIQILAPSVSLTAADEAVAGSSLEIKWTGPNNSGDYITIVAKSKPDGQYGNYSVVSKGSPLTVLVPIEPGAAELRYMTGQGGKVLARRPLHVVAAEVSLEAPAEVRVEAPLEVTWKGPNFGGDYLTIVPKGTRDGQYGSYVNTSAGSPTKLKAPKEPGEAEIRYMSGQGAKVLARRGVLVIKQE